MRLTGRAARLPSPPGSSRSGAEFKVDGDLVTRSGEGQREAAGARVEAGPELDGELFDGAVPAAGGAHVADVGVAAVIVRAELYAPPLPAAAAGVLGRPLAGRAQVQPPAVGGAG